MKAGDYQEAVIAVALQGEPNVLSALSVELGEDKFTGTHKKVYSAVMSSWLRNGKVELSLVAREIGPELNGKNTLGELRVYADTLNRLGLDAIAFPQWVRAVDDCGRLRQAHLFFLGNADELQDIDKAFHDIDNVDNYLAALSSEFHKIQARSGRAGYKPIAEWVEIWRQHVLEGGMPEFIPTGIKTWDERLLGLPIGLTVLCGLPSTGKTQLALEIGRRRAIALQKAEREGVVLINSIEMSGDKLITRLACSEARIDSRRLRAGLLDADEKQRLEDTVAELEKLPIFVDDSDYVTSDSLTMQAMAYAGQDIGLLAIDFAELVRDERLESEELRVSGIYRNAKSIAKELRIPVILLAQYNRDLKYRADKLGTNFDIRYSGFAEIAADAIVHIYSPWMLQLLQHNVMPPDDLPPHEKRAYIVCGKNRDGPTGTLEMYWNPVWTRWADVNEPEHFVQSGADF